MILFILKVLISIILLFSKLVSQSTTISGYVENNEGEPLVGANVFIEGTSLGVATDAEGKYQIQKVPQDRDYSISAMYIGHRKVTKNFSTKLESSLKIDFQLVLSLVDLDEVIVAASFSERKKRAQASPITIISQDDLRRLPVRSVDEVLSGKVPGGYANLPSRPGQNNLSLIHI